MNNTEQMSVMELRVKDVKSKNVLSMVAFLISILSAAVLSIIEGNVMKIALYGSEFVLLLGGFFVIRFIKKHFFYSYYLVIIAYAYTFIGIFLLQGSLAFTVIIFFLLVLSTIFLVRTVFWIGFIAGAIALYLNSVIVPEGVEYLGENISTVLATYILAGLLCGILIHLNRKQYSHIEGFLHRTEELVTKEEEARASLERNVADIIQRITDMNRNVQDNILSQREISIAINEVAVGSSEQNEKITDIAQSSQGTLQQASYMLVETKDLLEKFGQSSETAAKGNNLLLELSSNTGELRDYTEELSETFNALSNKIAEINTFSQSIIDVSQQTNLLALNASIEAARAGESGKGFSVVAEEIRKLAEDTNEAAEKITSNLVEINQTNNTALEKMSTNVDMSHENLEKTEQVKDAFQELADYLSEMNNKLTGFEQLATSVKENSSVVDAATNDLAAIIEETSASLEEMGATVENLNDQNEQISEEMKHTETVAKSLINENDKQE
ncbi:methyl-accepting chemotaxis protein [Gracilibacillus halotolerans]|uniref:Methyl-accepting chemotaxis protein n=1 Tax=Gracilibacillus halotolerans TaxID=74386 RepID=A0A841RIV8_9BACI|nr:methyl-accepting chemotaxis protein [Gracilibacillus halotolerans]MBB6512429.1 methyl-accepting chemotaxis protein [Gracilibacillus halotolerans]